MHCSLCFEPNLNIVLDLGLHPLANKYPTEEQIKDEIKYPLQVCYCSYCKNVQLSYSVSRNTMFEDYYYLSSVNGALVKYFEGLALILKDSKFVVDIGSNDGILLKPLKELGVKCLGVDPSINVGKIANDAGFETIVSFFDEDVVEKIINENGKPDVIICSSTFTHLENPHNFIKNAKKLLAEDGKLIIEVEYIGNFLKNIHFERFYLDRIYYYSLTSLKHLFEKYNMSICDVEEIEPHGGSLKITITNGLDNIPSINVIDWLEKEERELNEDEIKKFVDKSNISIGELRNKLLEYKSKGLKICGYGSPARVSTICNYGKIGRELIAFTVDDSPLKVNRFTPGTHIPIVSREKLEEFNPDVIVMFAYEYFEDIKKKLNKEYKFLLPIPPREVM